MSNHSPLCNKRVNCSIEQMARFTNHETGLLDQFQATLHIPGTKKSCVRFSCFCWALILDIHSCVRPSHFSDVYFNK